MKQHEAKFWMGGDPKNCDICHKSLGDEFVDGATILGPWGIMCHHCFNVQGVGLGIGRGQRYEQQPDGRWLKVELSMKTNTAESIMMLIRSFRRNHPVEFKKLLHMIIDDMLS